MRKIPALQPLHDARWGPGDVPWQHSGGALVPWSTPGWGISPKRLRGPTLGQPRRLRDDRPDGNWPWGVNSHGFAFLPPPRQATVDIVTLDEGTARAFAASPQGDTYPGTGGTHITGPADRDLLLILPTSGPRTAAIHVWGYRGVYMLGGRLKPLPTGTVTTLAAVNATTVWNGLTSPMVRIIPHPNAVDPFAFIAGVLPGVMRSVLLDDPDWQIRETRLTRADVERAQAIVVCNALRGALRAQRAGSLAETAVSTQPGP